MTAQAASPPADGAQTLHRAVALLRALGARPEDGATAAGLAQECALARSTAHRLLAAMAADGLVVLAPAGRRYYLGPLVYELGLVASPAVGLREICADIVGRLAANSNAVCFLTVRSGLDGVCVDRQGDEPSSLLPVEVGSRRPLGVGLGSIAILAALPDEECERVIRRNGLRYAEFNPLGAGKIRTMVSRTRKNGYAYTASDYIPGIGGFALPISSPLDGTVFAALSVASPVARVPGSRVKELLPLIRSDVQAIEARLRQRA